MFKQKSVKKKPVDVIARIILGVGIGLTIAGLVIKKAGVCAV